MSAITILLGVLGLAVAGFVWYTVGSIRLLFKYVGECRREAEAQARTATTSRYNWRNVTGASLYNSPWAVTQHDKISHEQLLLMILDHLDLKIEPGGTAPTRLVPKEQAENK